MTLDPALLRAILEAPDLDLPRLAAADWLREHGDNDRAEFIAVQIELAKLRAKGCHEGETCNNTGPCSECSRDVQAEPLRKRERELFRDVWMVLPEEVDAYLTLGEPEVIGLRPGAKLTRGFVSSLTLSWADWTAHSAALLASCPIRNAADGLVRLTTWPAVSHDIGDRGRDLMAHLSGSSNTMRITESMIRRHTWDQMQPRVAADLLASEWPGVRFELPTAPVLQPRRNQPGAFGDDLRLALAMQRASR